MATKQTKRRTAGRCAKHLSRRGVRRARRPAWVGRLRRLKHALASSWRMIDATMHEVGRAAERAARCPVRTSQDLRRLGTRLIDVSERLQRAVRRLSETTDAMTLDRPADGPWLLTDATVRWLATAKALGETSDQIMLLQEGLLADLLSGAIAPEVETPRRLPHIRIVPRLISARDFLLCRRPSARDRIASVPARRRRTACRATTDAPRRISRGRAPPLFSSCLL